MEQLLLNNSTHKMPVTATRTSHTAPGDFSLGYAQQKTTPHLSWTTQTQWSNTSSYTTLTDLLVSAAPEYRTVGVPSCRKVNWARKHLAQCTEKKKSSVRALGDAKTSLSHSSQLAMGPAGPVTTELRSLGTASKTKMTSLLKWSSLPMAMSFPCCAVLHTLAFYHLQH